jgi:hypothetical protein
MNTDILLPEIALDRDALNELAAYEGPCMTMLLPEYAPGGSHPSHEILAKTLLQGVEGQWEDEKFAGHEIGERARKAALEGYHRASLAVLDEYREMWDRHRTLHDIDEVLRASMEGRIHRLCIREGASVAGRLPNGIDNAALPNEDLANAAAVGTLRTSGHVYIVPPEHMPAEVPVAAILRY